MILAPRRLSSRRAPGASTAGQPLDGEVELEDVDPRLTEEAEDPSSGVPSHEVLDGILAESVGGGDARRLGHRVLGRDVRVETAA